MLVTGMPKHVITCMKKKLVVGGNEQQNITRCKNTTACYNSNLTENLAFMEIVANDKNEVFARWQTDVFHCLFQYR
jgi:hypothetical protein